MTELLGPVPFDFATRVPGPPLDRFVETLWYARGTVPYTREKIAPTGSTVAVLVLGDAIRQTPANGEGPTLTTDRGFLIGPHDGPLIHPWRLWQLAIGPAHYIRPDIEKPIAENP